MLLSYNMSGEGPLVVLLHGFPFDGSVWADAVKALDGRHRILTVDLRGFGGSGLADLTSSSMEEMARDVFETVDHRGEGGPFVVGGFSMGGYVALAMAAEAPARLRGLMMIASKATADSPEAAKGREENARKVEETGSPRPVVDTMVPKLFAKANYEQRADLVEHWKGRMLMSRPEVVAAALRGMAARPDRVEVLGSIPGPSLVMAGADDQMIPFDEARLMARTLPDSRLVSIPDAGHMLLVEQPEAAGAAIRDYLEQFE